MKHNSGIIYRDMLHKVTKAFIYELCRFFFFKKYSNIMLLSDIELLFFIQNLNVNRIFNQNLSETNTVIKNVIFLRIF